MPVRQAKPGERYKKYLTPRRVKIADDLFKELLNVSLQPGDNPCLLEKIEDLPVRLAEMGEQQIERKIAFIFHACLPSGYDYALLAQCRGT